MRTIMRLECLQLRHVVTRNKGIGAIVGPACRLSGDWQDALTNSEIEGVIIASPPATHYAIAAGALEAGKAVLVEKPLVLDVTDAQRLLSLTRKYKGRVLVDHTHLFNPAYRRLRELLADAGSIRTISSHGGGGGPFRRGHPVLWDWASHDVAMCLDMLGERPSQFAVDDIHTEEHPEGPGARYVLRLGFGNAVMAHIETGNLMPRKQRRFEVHTDDAIFLFDDLRDPKLSVTEEKPDGGRASARNVDHADELPVDRLLKDFAQAGRSPAQTIDSLALGVEVVRVLAKFDELAKRTRSGAALSG